MAVRRSRPAGGPSPDGEEQNGVSLPLAGPAEVMGRGRGWAHRHRRGKQSRQQECSWKQAQTQNMQCRLGNNGADWMRRRDDGGPRESEAIRRFILLKTQSGFQLIQQRQPRSSTPVARMRLWNLWIHERKTPQRNQPTFFRSLGSRNGSNKWLFLKWLIISFSALSTAHPR